MSLRICLVACLSFSASLSAAEPIKALLITGGCCHDYENQKQIISEGLSQRANIVWTIVHDGGDSREFEMPLYKKSNWAQGYDVIVHNECFGGVVDPDFVKGITQAHFNGVPGVFIHCSLHSYRKSGAADAWRELLGLTSTSHEKQRPLHVVRLDVNHPVMIGFPQEWNTPSDELYKIEKVWPNCTPLATAYGIETMKDHPVIWVNTFGGTRIFGTSLGHTNKTMNTPEWLGLVSRGTLWVTGKLGDDGKPVPGYEGTGIKPIEIPGPQPVPETSLPAKK
jgi:type 1 glutamine amidotransferase